MMSRSLTVLLLSVIYFFPAHGQKKYSPASIHSHNDYASADPFYHAFKAGAGAIEADVFLRNGKLMVAHDSSGIRQEITLRKLYLEPIEKEFRERPRPLSLLIDFKEGYTTLLPRLLLELQPLAPLLKTDSGAAPVAIIITGNRPPPSEYAGYPVFISFDDDLRVAHTPEQWARVAQVSLNFANYSKWKGIAVLPSPDEKLLSAVINAVHSAGKKIRFWGAPDNLAAWRELMRLGADIICTDKVDELRQAIR